MDITATFAPATWRILGLSVAAGYGGLGLLAMFSPAWPSRIFGIPLTERKPVNHDPLARSWKLLGARDITIATALFVFNARNQPESMGVLISSGTILCAWDVYEVFRNNGWQEALGIAAGATIWSFIGLGLLGLKSYD